MQYTTLTHVGSHAPGEIVDGSEFPDPHRLIDGGHIVPLEGEEAKDHKKEPKDSPNLSEARKEAKDQKERADNLDADLKEALAFADRVKKHVDTLDDKAKKAFQDAVNE